MSLRAKRGNLGGVRDCFVATAPRNDRGLICHFDFLSLFFDVFREGGRDRLLNPYIDVWCINLIGGILKLRGNSRVKVVLTGRSSGT